MRRIFTVVFLAAGCASDPVDSAVDASTTDTAVSEDSGDTGTPSARTLSVQLPSDFPGLRAAAEDLVQVAAASSGGSAGSVTIAQPGHDADAAEGAGSAEGWIVNVRITADAGTHDQGFALSSTEGGIEVRATSDIGAMYGLYRIAADLGALWIHPEEAFVPTRETLVLPSYDDKADAPRFDLRGFHEHTQHPIPMSDYLLRPDTSDFRARVSRYLRWMARNRQNVLFFHALKTIDMATWTPYMQSIAAEADGYGIHLGSVISFADEQQHAFKLLTSGPENVDADIRSGLDTILDAGFDMVGFQIGTSEFTKPPDADVLHWLDVATEHVKDAHPGVTPWAWIHITCTVEADDGSKFFHLPLKASADLGAFVHTTMFYTLDDPAPVYGCEDFSHQGDFLDAAEGKRPLVYFPETAWWLGFDNNVPLVLPLTGLSREQDIAALNGRDVSGHVTFTSGREWTYWQYDHHLTRATWSGETWDDYLTAITPVYGDSGFAITSVIRQVTELQRKLLYEDNPELIFSLAGELPQDEAGAQAGILARRPKIAFKTVHDYDEAEFAAWKTRDYDRLTAFQAALAPVIATLPDPVDGSTDEAGRILEAVEAYRLLEKRVDHTLALYGAVIDIRAKDRPAAEAKLATAKAITTEVKAAVARVEAIYRDPLPILTEPKPDTLTAYPIGYLSETRTAYFWSRRDDQLAYLITVVFDAVPEVWKAVPDALYELAGEGLALTQPESPAASAVLGGFIPRLLLGVSSDAAGASLTLAEDANENALPDPNTERTMTGPIEAGRFKGEIPRFDLVVHDSAGATIGIVGLLNLKVDVALEAPTTLGVGTLTADLETEPLIQAVLAIAGIDREGIESLVKGVFGLPAEEPLPATLPVEFDMTPALVPSEP